MPAELITASYATSTVAFAVLAVLLLTSWKGRLQGGLLVCAVLTTVLWSGLLTYQAYVDALDARSVFATEVLRDIAWLLFLLKLLEERLSSRRALIQIAIVTVLLAASAWFIAGITQAEGPVWRAPKGLIVVFIALAVNGIVLIEQLYRNAQPEHRWKIKFLCLGLGSIMSYDLYMYSHALLVQNLQGVMWWSRGLLNAIVAPLIMVAAARNPHWSLDVFVSRKVVFHSFSLVAIGIYLLAMSFVGYAINLQGGVWGQTLQIAFLFGAAVLLALVLLSGQIRAKIKVFLNKHFFNYKYDYRDEWLRLTNTLAAADASDELPLGAIQCLGQIVDSRGGVLYLHDEEEGGCAAVQTFEVTGPCEPLPVSAPLWRFLRRRHWIVDLAEHATNPGRYDHMEIPREISEITDAWLIVPLFHSEELLGVVVLLQSRAPRQLNWEDFDLLKTASYQVASDIAHSQAANALACAKQFEAYNRVSAFIMHDLKNVIGQLSLVVENGKRLRGNQAFVDDAFVTVENAVTRMKRLLNQLRQSRDLNLSSRVSLKSVVERVVKERALAQPTPTLSPIDSECTVIGNIDRLTSIIGNVIQNAQDATPPDGYVRVTVRRELSEVIVSVEDNGTGMSPEFVRTELFKPFASSKGEGGMGVGAYEAKEYLRSLGGRIAVHSELRRGTRIDLYLPRVHTDTIGKVA